MELYTKLKSEGGRNDDEEERRRIRTTCWWGTRHSMNRTGRRRRLDMCECVMHIIHSSWLCERHSFSVPQPQALRACAAAPPRLFSRTHIQTRMYTTTRRFRCQLSCCWDERMLRDVVQLRVLYARAALLTPVSLYLSIFNFDERHHHDGEGGVGMCTYVFLRASSP